MRRGDDLGPEEPDRDRDQQRDADGRQPPPLPRSGVTPQQVLIAILAILLVAFGIANFRRVEVSFLLFTTDARVITVIAVAGGLGFVIGYFVGRPTREQRKYLRRRDDD